LWGLVVSDESNASYCIAACNLPPNNASGVGHYSAGEALLRRVLWIRVQSKAVRITPLIFAHQCQTNAVKVQSSGVLERGCAKLDSAAKSRRLFSGLALDTSGNCRVIRGRPVPKVAELTSIVGGFSTIVAARRTHCKTTKNTKGTKHGRWSAARSGSGFARRTDLSTSTGGSRERNGCV